MGEERFFATCPRGLEALLAAELAQLGAAAPTVTAGGVHFGGGFAAGYRANLESRIASRVLWRLAGAPYRSEDDIYRVVHGLPWPNWFDPECTIKVQVAAVRSPLRSLDFVTLRVKDAVCDRFRADAGRRPDVETSRPDIRIHCFLSADELTVYLDTSGEALFKRGWRRGGEAPLRENLAAGILRLAGWEPGLPLLDPMCGGGTFLAEAAQTALGIAPGLGRGFALEKLGNFDRALWQRLRRECEERRRAAAPLALYGSDASAAAVKAARANLEAAGVAGAIELRQTDVLEIAPPAPAGLLLMNPPYGVRTGEQADLARFYPRLGDLLKQRFAGWRACIFTADLRLPGLIRLKPARRVPLFNGPLECRLYEFRMVEGSLRKRP